jgi:hypothetical protein
MYEVREDSPQRLVLITAGKTRRGRGVLFATAPLVVYLLAASALFLLAARDVSLWPRVKQAWAQGLMLAAALAVGCFLLGRRVHHHLTATADGLHLMRVPALGTARILMLPYADLAALAVDPSLRSLGADVVLVAVHRDGRRIPLLEGDAHSQQIRAFAEQIAARGKLPVEAPKLTGGGSGSAPA